MPQVSRKNFLIAMGAMAAGTAFSGVLSGCGSKAGTGGGGAAGAGKGPITVRMISHNTLEKPGGEFFTKIIDEYQKLHTDIKVDVESVPNAQILTKSTAYAQANNLPDLLDGQFGVAAMMAIDSLQPIDDLIDQAAIRDKFFEICLKSAMFDGKTYGLPLYSGTDALFYRKDYMQEAGLDPTKPPRTWDEILQVAKKLTNKDKGRYGFTLYGKTHTARVVYFMMQAGEDGDILVRDAAKKKWAVTINSPASQKAWQYLADMHLVHKVVPPNVVELDYPANVSLFAGGNTAMMTTGPWGSQTFIGTNPDIAGKFGVGYFPTPDGKPPVLPQGAVVYFMSKTTKNRKEAFDLLKFLTHDRNVAYNAAAGYGPTIKAALEAPEIKKDPFLPVFVEQMKSAVISEYNQEIKEMQKINETWTAEWQAVLTGTKTVKDATNKAAKGIADILGDRAYLKYT